MEKKIGDYSFVIGVILAIVLGVATNKLGTAEPWLVSLLVLLGLVVGFINVTGKDTKEFLMISVMLVIIAYAGSATGTLGGIKYIGPYLGGILTQIMVFVVPAAIVVALKDIVALAKND